MTNYASSTTFTPGSAAQPAGRLKALATLCLIGAALTLSATPAWSQVGHVHELYYNNSSWIDTDLTGLTAANPASSFAGMSSFTTANGALHINYQDEFSNIHQLYTTGGPWFDASLTSLTNGATARSGGSAMAGFASGNNQFVYFVGWDLHIHEYSYVNSWVDSDLTAITGSPLAGPAYDGKQLAAVLTSDNFRHVFYTTKRGAVVALTLTGSGWSKQTLSGRTRAFASTASFDNWIGACGINTYPFVFFSSPDGHLHEFSHFRSWQDTDLTAQTGATTTGTVSVASVPGISVCGVFYNDTNGHVHQISNDGSGFSFVNDKDLTALTGGSMIVNGGAGFSTSPGNWERFFTRSGSGVNQFTFNGTNWSFQSLPGGAYWEPYGLTGFSVGSLEHVYYLASSN